MQVFRPTMQTEEILEALRPVLESGWIGLGPKTQEFEKAVAEYIDINEQRVWATNSCTGALHMAVKNLGLQPGDKVLTTPMTFVSTNHALLYEGLEPVFYDTVWSTGCADPESIERMLDRVDAKAIVVVHLGGYPCDMPRINALALASEIPIIEDCAHAAGSRYYSGHCVGDSQNQCCFSFHAVKNLPTADGGILTVPSLVSWKGFDPKVMRWLGIDKDTHSRTFGKGYSWEYDVPEVGFKYHMNDIAATIALEQLKVLDKHNKRRREIAEFYRNNISLDGTLFPSHVPSLSSNHFFPIFFNNRNEVHRRLTMSDIYPGMHYKSNHHYPMYEMCEKDGHLPGATWYEEHELTLPIHPMLTDSELRRVVEVVNE